MRLMANAFFAGILDRCSDVITDSIIQYQESIVKRIRMANAQGGVLLVEYLDVGLRESGSFSRVNDNGRALVFLREDVERFGVYVSVDQYYSMLRLLHEFYEQAECVV